MAGPLALSDLCGYAYPARWAGLSKWMALRAERSFLEALNRPKGPFVCLAPSEGRGGVLRVRSKGRRPGRLRSDFRNDFALVRQICGRGFRRALIPRINLYLELEHGR